MPALAARWLANPRPALRFRRKGAALCAYRPPAMAYILPPICSLLHFLRQPVCNAIDWRGKLHNDRQGRIAAQPRDRMKRTLFPGPLL
jgi:hypothetical protein